jgi:hypothetical protein
MRWTGLLISCLIFSSGCSSFRTTAVDRTETDCLVVNPNCPMKGVPVSLRVPTHLELQVVETSYWEKKNMPGEKPTIFPLAGSRPTRQVLHTVCETEKIFLVDPARPVAGTSGYGFTFQSSQNDRSRESSNAGKGYLQSVQYRVDDQTINRSAELLSSSIGLINALQTSSSLPTVNQSNLIATDRTIAYARFDLNSPSFEADVAAFLDGHVNTPVCHRPSHGTYTEPVIP